MGFNLSYFICVYKMSSAARRFPAGKLTGMLKCAWLINSPNVGTEFKTLHFTSELELHIYAENRYRDMADGSIWNRASGMNPSEMECLGNCWGCSSHALSDTIKLGKG